jgi:hypothetical protein
MDGRTRATARQTFEPFLYIPAHAVPLFAAHILACVVADATAALTLDPTKVLPCGISIAAWAAGG